MILYCLVFYVPIILIQSCSKDEDDFSKFRGETSYIAVAYTMSENNVSTLNVFQHVYHRNWLTRARYVFSLRERPILLFSLLSLLLAPTDVIQRGDHGPPRFREGRRERGGEGGVAWVGGQSYRGGWLAPVNGFRGQWRYTARSHGPSPKNYEPASSSFRNGSLPLLASCVGR